MRRQPVVICDPQQQYLSVAKGDNATLVQTTQGKGRFGKRATSTCQDYYERNTNDNSNDSGFECDWNSQSESQFAWHSNTEDLNQQKLCSIPKLSSSSSYLKVNGEQGGKRSEIHPQSMKNAYLPMKKSNEEFITNNNGLPLALLGKGSMSPDSTMPSPTASRGSNETMSSSPTSNSSDGSSSIPSPVPIKRPRFCFPSNPPTKATGLKLRNQNGVPVRSQAGKRLPAGTIPTLTSNLSSVSRDGRVQLQILAQPEEQHRARYQTEGSRGAIKDRKLNGFPTVKLCGYDKPATLQIFIGTDQGKVSPHMFYQACKVTGKSSTPCIEKKVEGTVLIEIEFEPSKDMVISCDCVGILKERNVDVEQRFPFHHAAQSRKKSTKCRMIFRSTIINSMGMEETLQVPSVPILCTQPPGQPEICKQSIVDCPSAGGKELFIIGKNFLKDTKIVISEENNNGDIIWETKSTPLKDYLQQTHLICVVPAYKEENIQTEVDCKLSVWSGGRLSEPHRFTYFPNISPAEAVHVGHVNSTSLPDSPSQTLIQSSMGHSLSQCQQVVPVEIQVQSIAGMPVTTTEQAMVSPTSGMSPVCHLNSTTVLGSPAVLSNGSCSMTPTVEPTLMDHLPTTTHTTTLGQLAPLTFESNMIATTQQERLVVNELQSLLEQSAQQQQCQVTTDTIMTEVKSDVLMSTGTSMDIKPTPTFTTLSPNMSTSVVSPMELSYSNESTRIADISTGGSFSSLNVPFQDTIMSSVQPQMLTSSSVALDMNSMVVRTTQQQMPLLSPVCSTTVPLGSPAQHLARNPSINMNMGCPTIMKSEQQARQICQGSEVPVSGGGVFINGELQGPIANALTQMSDNELINYINPSCFDQGSF